MISRIPGFYKLPPGERLKTVAEQAAIGSEDISQVERGLLLDQAEKMVENVIGMFQVPLGIATNFMIDGQEVLIPMATEEPSVIAAASNGARMARGGGGFLTSSTGPVMRAQIQATGIDDPFAARQAILLRKDELMAMANELDPMLVKYGGGVKDIEVHVIDSRLGPMLVTHLIVDCRDAMGANAVNTMAESLAPRIEQITGGRVYLRIISNLADLRLARARAVFRAEDIGGPEVVDGIILAAELAVVDPYRAATHNKGIMNGVTAVVLATGNDTRAVEAGAHSYASQTGRYTSLTRYERNRNGDLVGTIELPVAVGLVGGATRVHPVARTAVKILGVKSADHLSRIIAAVGLCQNFAALRALASEGIQRGHMSLHARNVAVQAGAKCDLIELVAARMAAERRINVDRAAELLRELEEKGPEEV
ncbi:MAG TPA: hydroxymethylglutaryl-CoA reductase, degradative [Methanothrix sp.]|jgi:hydroxymethylglutaryl-CoA reductase|uniref:hydroxymethylglutaryl-CoA reductase, degradative n=1 Tax=Methanothrix sp. TaxID=90426 RepID=UPI002B9828DC|nr:hydroxymethylglutaryl-CoA reductase, degradative [Methanothrix sp.]MDI9416257.1 hydroxymethylglutaryl-CoA reductase, degradative [Euryarchaeota archaeon]HON36982.1 hydroxymethylglutaryl-CoA reductase, degradative [Methanothrix sp.]HRU75858.1 hydroxymethylglutaryl-CoA reductase, degradative [Methanothrix sp.]